MIRFMSTISRLFGRSPFSPLKKHMDKVASCIEDLPLLLEALYSQDTKKIEKISDSISKKEHEADLTKNDIRNHLPKGLFLPIDRGTLLEILSLQDAIGDKAEDIGILLTIAPLKDGMKDLQDELKIFCDKNIAAFHLVNEVIHHLENLLEYSFGGNEAKKVKEMIEEIAFQEHEVDRMQYSLVKKVYKMGEKMAYPTFHLWLKLLKEIGAISNLSEKLANRIRMTLELK